MLYVKGADNLEPYARLDDLKIIREIATKCGLKTKIVAAPSEEIVETKVLFCICFPYSNIYLKLVLMTGERCISTTASTTGKTKTPSACCYSDGPC